MKPPPDTCAPDLPLEQIVVAQIRPISRDAPEIQFDASPWGGGAVLMIAGSPAEYWAASWDADTASRLGVKVGQPHGQTAWEYLVALLSLIIWGVEFSCVGLRLLGDNLAALNGALSLRGRGGLTQITKEFAWGKVRFRWRFAAGHLPSEHNVLADALSRLDAEGPERKEFPTALRHASLRELPALGDLWVCSQR